MRILFMGTPDFAVPCLEKLVEDGHNICGAFTRADKPKGRGYTLLPPPVKETALKYGIPVFQPTTLKDESVVAQIRELAPELIVVVAYGRILPESVLSIPERGCINVHGSLLPKYRGSAPIQRAVMEGEKVTGITTMFMAKGIDTGDIILTKQTEIGEDETAGELFDRLMLLGAQTLSETLRMAEQGELPRRAQDDSASTYAPPLQKSEGQLDFSRRAQKLHDLIRGLNPWPSAFTTLDGKVLKIHASKILDDAAAPASKPGTVLSADSDGIAVSCGEGILLLTQVQAEGGKKMPAGDYLRGHAVKPGTLLGE